MSYNKRAYFFVAQRNERATDNNENYIRIYSVNKN